MTRPAEPPHLPEGLPSTPRVASVSHLRRIAPDLVFPVPSDLLVEVLPFGLTPVDDGEQWVAVRLTVDMLLGKASASEFAWIERTDFEALVPLRSMLVEAPDTAESFVGDGFPTEFVLLPSARTMARCHPRDGVDLLASWQNGRSPVMATIAWLQRAGASLDDEQVATVVRIAHQAVASGEPVRNIRPIVVEALELAIPIVCAWSSWPCPIPNETTSEPTVFDKLAESMGLPHDVFEILADGPFEVDEDADDWLPPDDWPWDPDQ